MNSFFPWLGVDPTVVLHLKDGPHGTHHQLNHGEENEKEEEEGRRRKSLLMKTTLLWPGFEPLNYVARAKRSIL